MTDMTVAHTIIQQMGGQGKLKAMVGAHNFAAGENYVQFSFRGSRKHNKCRVELDRGSDTYNFNLYQWRKKKLELAPTHEATGLYWDMLKSEFERETGLRLSL